MKQSLVLSGNQTCSCHGRRPGSLAGRQHTVMALSWEAGVQRGGQDLARPTLWYEGQQGRWLVIRYAF